MDTLLSKTKKEVHLEPHEKLAMRERLVAFMAEHPLHEKKADRSLHHPGASYYQRSSTLLGYQVSAWRKVVPALLLIIFVGTGTSFAAEGTLPGDALYPIKIHVNEPLKQKLAFTPQAQAQVEIELASRRLTEGEKLAQQGNLTPVVQATLETEFLAHSEKAQEHIIALQSSDHARDEGSSAAVDASVDLQSSLTTHTRILATLADKQGTSSDRGLRVLLGAVRQRGERAAALKLDTVAQVEARSGSSTIEGAEQQLVAAESQLQVTAASAQKLSRRVRPRTRDEIRTRTQVAERIIAEGKKRLNAGASSEAAPLFKQAREMGRETKIFVETTSAVTASKEDTVAPLTATTTALEEATTTPATAGGAGEPATVGAGSLFTLPAMSVQAPSVENHADFNTQLDL